MSIRVEVDQTTHTIVLIIDDQKFVYSTDPSVAQESVDQLRRIAAAAQHAVRLVRSPESRRAVADPLTPAPRWLDTDNQ